MVKIMCCPFFEREIRKRSEKSRELVGVKCKSATIRFPSKQARREFVYPYCGSLKGYKECPIYKFLEKEDL